jgi:hypothetical protein
MDAYEVALTIRFDLLTNHLHRVGIEPTTQ